MSYEYGCGRTRYPWHIVVFRQPVTPEAEGFRVLCGPERYCQRVSHRTFFSYRNEIEHGEWRVAKGFHEMAHQCIVSGADGLSGRIGSFQ